MTEATDVRPRVSILIADDHGVLRAGLRALLNAEPDMKVVGEAADGKAAIEAALAWKPDLVIADISMPGRSGIDIARELRQSLPGTRVLILTMHEDRGLLEDAISAGVCGYVAKRSVESDLIAAIRAVARGGTYFQGDAKILAQREKASRAPTPMPTANVTPAELELLRLFVQGYPMQKAADTLKTNPATIEQLRAGLETKLGLHSRVDMLRYAREHGLV